MNSPWGIVVGTAGHIDHGKTSLVYALTGIDTDRLAEEKRRGISIDLGFAHLNLPNGTRISFIDVPGHERFIRNMLAGVGGIQAVLLIVAADESVKPQTREHLEICRLLGIELGIIVLTKTDVASPEQIDAAREEIRGLCANSFLAGAPLVLTSSVTGEGLVELQGELSSLAERVAPRDQSGLARLPIDRSFALKGFGTVVTGTLWSGTLQAGDRVRIHPIGREARIRGLQVHGEQVTIAVAGQRTAVNLAGIESLEIRRGFVLSRQEGLEMTKLIGASIDWLSLPEIPEKREQFALHIGTMETPAILKVLKKTGSRTLALIWLSEFFVALPGDRFVLRSSSPAQTVAGGCVIDAFPPKRLNRSKTAARLEALAESDASTRIHILAQQGASGIGLAELVRSTGLPAEKIKELVHENSELIFAAAAERVVTKTWVAERRRRLVEWLSAFHRKNASAEGAPVSLARLGLEPNLAKLIFENCPGIRVQGDLVALETHKIRVSDAQNQSLQQIERAYRAAGFQPPSVNEVLQSAGYDLKNGRGLLESLIKSQKLVRITENLIVHADVVSQIRKSLSMHKGRKFSVPEFKEWTQVSRKYAIPLLEYLDRQHVTRREGDSRIVL